MYNFGPDGRTPYERLHGHKFNRPLASLGGTVHYKPLKKEARLFKLEPNWFVGMSLGSVESSGECVISDEDGQVLKCRDMKRMMEGLRFDKDLLSKLKATLWQFRPGGEQIELAATSRNIEMKEPSIPPRMSSRSRRSTGFYVTKTLVDKHGRTHGCPGRAQRGVHNDACRTRIIEKIRSDTDAKEKYEQRDTLEGQHERAIGTSATPTVSDFQTAPPDDGRASGSDGPVAAPVSTGANTTSGPAVAADDLSADTRQRPAKRALEDPPSREELFPEGRDETP